MLLLCVYGLPAFIASIPGFVALGDRRSRLGWALIVGGVIVAIPGAFLLDRARTSAMTEAGLVADDWAVSLVLPFFLSVLYAIAGGIVYVVLPLLFKRSNRTNS
jgi:hypothetical protein